MTQPLSLYISRDSTLHRLHPLTKLALAAWLLTAGLTLPGPCAPYAIFVLVTIPIAVWGRVAGNLLRAIWPVILPFAISVFLIQGFLWPGGTPLFVFGPASLKREGLIFATASLGRILTIVGAFVLLALTTRPDVLMLGLTQRGLPPALAYLIVATVQIVPRFQARANSILDAQRARGLETGGSPAGRLRAIIPLVVPLVLSSLIDVEERALAIEARAFSVRGPKTSLFEIGEARGERPVRWLLLLSLPLLPVLRLLTVLP